jgi:hypothetical protein
MLSHPTFDHLRALQLTGMLKALQDQQQLPDIERLSFLERLGLLLDRQRCPVRHQHPRHTPSAGFRPRSPVSSPADSSANRGR